MPVAAVQPSARAVSVSGRQVANRLQVGGRWSGRSSPGAGRQPGRRRRQGWTARVGEGLTDVGESGGRRAMSVQVGEAAGQAIRLSGRAIRSQVLRRRGPGVGRGVLMSGGSWVGAMVSGSAWLGLVRWAGGRRSGRGGDVPGWWLASSGQVGSCRWSEGVRGFRGRGEDWCRRGGANRAAWMEVLVSEGRHGVIVSWLCG